MIGGSLVAGRPRCRAAAAAVFCCYCCWACPLLLPIIVVLLLLLLCVWRLSFNLCACSRTHGAFSRKLGERHASCDMPLSLLLQLRQLRLLRGLLRAAAAPAAVAAAVCCHATFESRSPGGGK